MIIWKGWGFLVVVFVFGLSLSANLITNSVTGGEQYWNSHVWPIGVSLIVSSLLCWFIGCKLASRGFRSVVDIETGEEQILVSHHSLFFIDMHWWAPILAAIGVVYVINDLI